MHKVYYNKKSKLTIVDVSGVKPFKDIESEFGKGVGDYDMRETDNFNHCFTIDKDKIEVMDIKTGLKI
jgi:hypothetical protein